MLQDMDSEEFLWCPYTNGCSDARVLPIEYIKYLYEISPNSDEYLIFDFHRYQIPDTIIYQLDNFLSIISIEKGDTLQFA